MQWVSVSVGFAWSVLFLVRNLYPVLNRADAQTSRLLLIGIVAAHAGLAIAVKFVFFRSPFHASIRLTNRFKEMEP